MIVEGFEVTLAPGSHRAEYAEVGARVIAALTAENNGRRFHREAAIAERESNWPIA